MTKSITLPNAELASLAADAVDISQATKSEATKRAYRSDLRLFNEFCERHEKAPLPATSETVGFYVVHMNKIGRKPATIRRALTSIAQVHLLAGYDSPINAQVLELKKGICRIRGIAQNKKVAITLDKLRRGCGETPPDFMGARDKALILVGWTGALRRSELVNIDIEDIEETGEGYIINVRRSKTDQEGAGRRIALPFIDGEPSLCAPTHLKRWIKISKIKDGAVFRGIGGDWNRFFGSVTHRMGSKTVSQVIKRFVDRAGYDPEIYSGHSLRSGLATTLARAGVPEREIMNITGHKSVLMLRTYIQAGSLFRNHPVLGLFPTDEDE